MNSLNPTTHVAFRGPVLLMAACSMIFSSMGCRAKMEVQTKSGGPAVQDTPLPPAGPVKRTSAVQQEPDKVLLPVKKVYQSREVLRIRVSKEMIGSATNVSVLNVTGITTENEGNAPVVLDQAPIPASLGLTSSDEFGSFDLTASNSMSLTRDAEGLVISIMPTNSDIRKQFKYGVNKLKIVVIDPVEYRFTYATITLKDFSALGPVMAHFANPNTGPVGKAADGSQLQGWLNVVSPPVVLLKEGTVVQGTLANGVYNIIQ